MDMVHEADTQRQHIRVAMPAKLEIDGTLYDSNDWSTGGVSISWKEGDKLQASIQPKKIYKAVLLFSFQGFEFKVNMEIEACHIDQKNNTAGFKFAKMNKEQVAIMKQLVNSYLTGEITSIGDIMNVVGRNNMTRPRNIPKPNKNLPFLTRVQNNIEHYVRLGLIILVSGLLLAYIGMSLYERVNIVSAVSAKITSDGTFVEAPTSGTVYYKDLHAGERVKKGEVMLTISTADNKVRSVDSPCDCYIQRLLKPINGISRKGQPLAVLVPHDAKLYVEAKIPYDGAVRIGAGQKAHLSLPGHDVHIMGTVESVRAGEQTASLSRVIINFDKEVATKFIGLPVKVTIDTLGLTN